MAVRSRLLVNQLLAGGTSSHAVYTPPAGRTAIIRRWSLVNRSGAARGVALGVRRAGALVQVAYQPALADGGSMGEADTSLVLEPGDGLEVLLASATGGTGNVHLSAAGSLLLGEPA